MMTRCARCNGSLVRGYPGEPPSCLMCGQTVEPPAPPVVLTEEELRPAPQGWQMPRDTQCPECGLLYTAGGVKKHLGTTHTTAATPANARKRMRRAEARAAADTRAPAPN